MTLIEALCLSIETWLGRHKNANLNVLSDRCSMPYSTLYKIYQGRMERPQIDSVLSILRVVTTKEERANFLRKYYPAMAEDFGHDAHFMEKAETRTQKELPELDKEFVQRDSFLLAQFLLSDCGITRSKIQLLFGSHGLELLERYDQAGYLTLRDGSYRIEANYLSTSLESNLIQIKHAVDSFKPDGAEVNSAYLRSLSNGVSLEGAQRIKALLHETAIEIDRIAIAASGPHVFLTSLMTQLLDPLTAIEEARLKSGETK